MEPAKRRSGRARSFNEFARSVFSLQPTPIIVSMATFGVRQKILPKFIVRFGNMLFLAYLGGSCISLVLLESIYNGGFGDAVRLLSIPLAILNFGFSWWYRRDLYDLGIGRTKLRVMSCITYPILLLMGWPYVMACNAVTSSGKSVVYSGQVIRKFISGAQSESHQIVIMDRSSHEPIALTVSSHDFATLSAGDSIQTWFHIGGLGIPYRWRFEMPDRSPHQPTAKPR